MIANMTQTQKTITPILLSICIPTYNRPIEFKRLLNGLAPQITENVEIVIRDDSTDLKTHDTFERVRAGRAWNFNYLKGEKIGVDAANLLLAETARGKYIWWFSDDDEMRPGAVARVLDLIKQYSDISFIWVNFDFAIKDNPVVVREEGFFYDGNEVLETLGKYIGLLSSLIFKREEGLQALPLARKHIVGFSFAQLVLIFHVLSGGGKFYFLKGPYVLCHPTTPEEFKRDATKTGKIVNEAFNTFGIDFYDVLTEFSGKFKKHSIRKMLATNFASVWRGVVVAWVGGWDTPRGKRWKMFKYYWSFPEIWIAMLIFSLPLFVNKFLYKLYKIFFSHRKWIFGKVGRV